jgi:endonuclease-3 related protein
LSPREQAKPIGYSPQDGPWGFDKLGKRGYKRVMLSDKLNEIYELLLARFGGQGWWPGETAFEIMVGAILAQNTNWANVEKAIGNLKVTGCLSVEKIHSLSHEELAALIKPAGYFNIKANRLRNFIDWLREKYDGDIEFMAQSGTDTLREELLGVKGIGPETADSILLYALDREIFVVDAYTARIAVRHGLIEPNADYHELQELFQSNLPDDVKLFNEFHALIVQTGKNFCRPKPKCEACPLNKLPHTIEVEYY